LEGIAMIRDPFADQNWLLEASNVQIILDVGAHIGQTCERYHTLFPDAHIYSFEPFLPTFEQLKANVSKFGNATPMPYAIGKREGVREFYSNGASYTNSLFPAGEKAALWVEPFEQIKNVGKTQVSTTTLDIFCHQYNIKQIDILKLDIQGGELEAFQGAVGLLERQVIQLIYTETMFVPVYAGQPLFHDLSAFLSKYGYGLYNLYDLEYGNNAQLKWGNCIFLCSTLLSNTLTRVALPTQKTHLSPVRAFHSEHYLKHNEARQNHLASLGLQLGNQRVLEVGAGIGDHTPFFLERGCSVVVTEARDENIRILKERYPKLEVAYLNMDAPRGFDELFDIVYCYGLLYHLEHPQEAIEFMAERTGKLLLLETCVSFGDEEAVNRVQEAVEDPTQSYQGVGSRPTRAWVFHQLKRYLPHVYVPLTQPDHEEFPTDWQRPNLHTAPLARSIFIASQVPLKNHLLVEQLPLNQIRYRQQ
jgi:FkbM family methyltransferase